MDLGVFVVLSTVLPGSAFTNAITWSSDGFVELGTRPACPADLFDETLVVAACYQDWDRQGSWFMRLVSSGIPAHSYGRGDEPWDHLVKEQQWDLTIPLISDEDGIDAQIALGRDVDPTEFLTKAAREDRPIGMALNGVPFFSPLTATGADTVNPLPGKVVENETLSDECAGSLQAKTGAYGYRIMPPCLHGEISAAVLEAGGYKAANVLIGFEDENSEGLPSTPRESPLLGFAMDGRRIYGPYDSTMSLAWGLDVCNGRWEEQVDDTGGNTAAVYAYTYRATPSFPYLVGCWGPAGVPIGAASAMTTAAAAAAGDVASDSGGFVYSKIEGGFNMEAVEDGCPAGSFLSIDSGECEACRAGTYGKSAGLVGKGCPGVCPRGFYCPDGTATPTLRCPPGTFGALPGMTDEFCSGECQPGYFCLSGSVAPDSNECGSMTYYCPKGSGQRTPVTSGYYTTTAVAPDGSPPGASADAEQETATARRVRSGEAQCEAGTFCVGGRRRPCPSGTFGATNGLTSSNCSDICPEGSYCPEGSTEPIPCPAGTYGGEAGLSTQECSGLCAMGHYCPAGSVAAFQYACPAGRFGGAPGLTDGLCAEEGVCAREDDAPCLASLCDPGYFCPPGSSSARDHQCGSGEYYCPRGSGFPTTVGVGFYTYVEGSTDGGSGDNWSMARQLTRTAQAECEPGHYCVAGARLPCPPGTVGSSHGLASPSCSGPSLAGYYSGAAEAGLGERCGGARWFCPEASSSPSEVGAGNYTVGGPPDRRVAQETCPAGSYCQEGVLFPCPPGTFGSLPGLSSPACSGPCPAGRYCPSGTSPSISTGKEVIGIACPTGRYGVEGMGDAACTGACEAGYYCPEESTSAHEKECGSGSVYCPPESSAPVDVAPGWFATGGDDESIRSGQVKCIAAT
ncbi:unnamed protein product, partial [Ectocarpus sp. 12 AP-2014]